MSVTSVKVLMVEDEKLMRVGLKALLEEFPEINIIGEAQNSKEALDLYRNFRPEVILMDIGLQGIDGIETTKKILNESENNGDFCTPKIIMLTSHISEKEVNDSLIAGASAYVMKDINTEYLVLVSFTNILILKCVLNLKFIIVNFLLLYVKYTSLRSSA